VVGMQAMCWYPDLTLVRKITLSKHVSVIYSSAVKLSARMVLWEDSVRVTRRAVQTPVILAPAPAVN
jgi:hypothetical protein